MPEMTKANVRDMLQSVLARFKKVTGQRIAVVYTWEGGLSIAANSLFTQFIDESSDRVWNTLACPNENTSIPAQELEMAASIEEDITSSSVKSLRRMISWITRKSSGTTRHFWGNPSKQPIWWPVDVPFQNISRKEFVRSTLMKIIRAYKEYNFGAITVHDTNE